MASLLLVTSALASCAVAHDVTDRPPAGVPTPAETQAFGGPQGDDFLAVRTEDLELHVAASDWSLETDEDFPAERATVTGNDLYVFVPQAGWTLSATSYTGTSPYACGGRTVTPEQTSLGGGWWRVSAVGPAGDHVLHLWASSGPGLPLGGVVGDTEIVTSWHTTASTPWPQGGGVDVAIVPGEGGDLMLWISGLSQDPVEVSAVVTLTGESGEVITVHPTADPPNCGNEGSIDLRGTLTAAEGDAIEGDELDYVVELTIDGKLYRSTGTGDPLAELTFTPALP